MGKQSENPGFFLEGDAGSTIVEPLSEEQFYTQIQACRRCDVVDGGTSHLCTDHKADLALMVRLWPDNPLLD